MSGEVEQATSDVQSGAVMTYTPPSRTSTAHDVPRRNWVRQWVRHVAGPQMAGRTLQFRAGPPAAHNLTPRRPPGEYPHSKVIATLCRSAPIRRHLFSAPAGPSGTIKELGTPLPALWSLSGDVWGCVWWWWWGWVGGREGGSELLSS